MQGALLRAAMSFCLGKLMQAAVTDAAGSESEIEAIDLFEYAFALLHS
jgi:hypothetical protein